MTNPHKKSLPKYMNMQGTTQYELGQSIDSALEAAEQAVNLDQQGTCYEIWFDQLVDQLQDEFSFVPSVSPVNNAPKLLGQAEELFERCKLQFKLLQGPHGSQEAFHLVLKVILERSLMDALDLMHAQGIWRFDMQRQMQNSQQRVIELIGKCRF